jgi:hypothetical protein
MSFFSWLRNRTSTHTLQRQAQRRSAASRFRPHLETLDERCLPSTLTVTNTLDFGKGSLRYEVALADKSTKATTIDFAPGLQGTITLNSGQLDITQKLTILGPGAGQLKISGGYSSRVFEVAPNVTAAISGLTITQGNSGLYSSGYSYSGGDILNLGTLTLSNCTVSDGSTEDPTFLTTGQGSGGDIGNLGTMNLIGCTISGGHAGSGGGIFNGGRMTVSGGAVSGNGADNGGGGIYNYSGCTLSISGCTIGGATSRGPSNHASGYGGGILNDGKLTLTDCPLLNNWAYDVATGFALYGGGIYNAGTATVSGCTLTGNNASQGGGIYNAGTAAALTVLNSFFSSNSPDNIFGPYTDGGGNTFK